MSHCFEAESADQVWQLVAEQFRSGFRVRVQASRGGPTRELSQVLMAITKPRQRWVPSRSPALNPAFAIAEVVWILGGRNDSAFVNHWNPALPSYAGDGDIYHGAYGTRLRRQFGLDQLNAAYEALRHNPESRQVVLQMWNPSLDLPDASGHPRSPDIPCNICSMLKIRDGRLEWTQVMRSNDFFRGLPHNIVQFTVLQEVVAGWLGIEVGPYHHLSDSLHVYDANWEEVLGSHPGVAPDNTDSLSLQKPASDRVLREVERRLEVAAFHSVAREKLQELVEFKDAPDAYQNLLRVALADDARRRGWPDLAGRFMRECTNPALGQLWKAWSNRQERVTESGVCGLD